MTDSKEWCDGDWRWRSSSRPFAGAESGSPGRALEAGERGSPGRAVQAGIRGKRLIKFNTYSTIHNVHHIDLRSKTSQWIHHIMSVCHQRLVTHVPGWTQYKEFHLRSNDMI